LTVNDYRRHRTDAKGPRLFGYVNVIHVENRDFARRAGNPVNEVYRILTGWTARTEHFYLALGIHKSLLSQYACINAETMAYRAAHRHVSPWSMLQGQAQITSRHCDT
jgi:predicted transcriptional regulator